MKKFGDFFAQFGGSLRTKNLMPASTRIFDLKNIARYLLGRGPYSEEGRNSNKRRYNVPEVSQLPKEYIRLCPWEAQYLFMLASRAELGVVETGRFHGGSTFMLAWSNRVVPIHSVDIVPQNDELLQSYFVKHGIGTNVDLIVGDSQRTKYPHVGEFDLLFIDGDHSYEGCTADLENWYPNLSVGGHIVLHDSYHGSPVQESVIDFVSRHPELQMVQTPYINPEYWSLPAGSLAHLIKTK